MASRCGTFLIMPRPLYLQKADIQNFLLRYRLYICFCTSNGSFRIGKKARGNCFAIRLYPQFPKMKNMFKGVALSGACPTPTGQERAVHFCALDQNQQFGPILIIFNQFQVCDTLLNGFIFYQLQISESPIEWHKF